MKKDQDTQGRSHPPSPSPHRVRPLESSDDDEDDSSNTGNPKLWDAYAGMKPSWLDGCASDGEVEIEDDLPQGGAKELNGAMIDMMLDLGDYDERDNEWLLPKEWNKLEARKKGISVLRMRILKYSPR
jgi:hypothetical protein